MFDHDRSLAALQSPLPFDKCVITGLDEHDDPFIIMVQNAVSAESHEAGIAVHAQVLHKHGFDVCPPFFCMPQRDARERSEDGMNVYFFDKKDQDDPQNMDAAISSLVGISFWLERLNAERMPAYRATPSPSNPKRLRQGKKPLFDWHTVVVEPKRVKGEALGGTHATPRLHEVRGHWVTRNNKRFWRKPHKRGDATKGIVFHDYKITAHRAPQEETR